MVQIMPAHPIPDITGMLARAISMKQQKKEFAAEQKWRTDVEQPYKEAQAKYMNATVDRSIEQELAQKKFELEAKKVTMAEGSYKEQMSQVKALQTRIADPSISEDERTLARNAYLGIKTSQDQRAQIDGLRLGLETFMAQAKLNQDLVLNELKNKSLSLAVLEGLLSRENQMKKGRDKEYRESFDAGVDAIKGTLAPSGTGSSEKRPVKGKSFGGAGAGMTYPSAGVPQNMSLEQAAGALKTGDLDMNSFLNAFPELSGIIGEKMKAPAVGSSNLDSSSLEQNLMKRMQ